MFFSIHELFFRMIHVKGFPTEMATVWFVSTLEAASLKLETIHQVAITTKHWMKLTNQLDGWSGSKPHHPTKKQQQNVHDCKPNLGTLVPPKRVFFFFLGGGVVISKQDNHRSSSTEVTISLPMACNCHWGPMPSSFAWESLGTSWEVSMARVAGCLWQMNSWDW